MATLGQRGEIMTPQKLEMKLRELNGMVPIYRRDEFAPPNVIDEFNLLTHNAYHSLNNSYNVEMCRQLGAVASWGELQYGIGRLLRILNHRDPDPGAIKVRSLISPADFFQQTRKPGLSDTKEDERGTNLKRVDVNLIWFHVECKGDATDGQKLKRALLGLERAIEAYFAGKSWFNWENDRQRAVRQLQNAVALTKMSVRDAERFDDISRYSRGEMKIAYPDSFIEVLLCKADSMPSYIRVACEGMSRASHNRTDSQGDGFDRIIGAIDTAEQLVGAVDTTQSILDVFVNLL